MNIFFQVIGTIASILSIPLAIYFYFKSNDSKQDRVRRDIIKTLSYKVGEGNVINKLDIVNVYNSKLREYNIKKPSFTTYNILEDLISDVLSNPFLGSVSRGTILENLKSVSDLYLSGNEKEVPKTKIGKIKHTLNSPYIFGLLMVTSFSAIISLTTYRMTNFYYQYDSYSLEYNLYSLFNNLFGSYLFNIVFMLFTICTYTFIYTDKRKNR